MKGMNLPINQILEGDVLARLKDIPDESVDCCVTSPPYWGLRDYGIDGQLGAETTPELYVENLVSVFSEVKRVLKIEGTLWLNLGDSYAAGKSGRDDSGTNGRFGGERLEIKQRKAPKGLKSKDLVGIPWMVAFALRKEGWYLRQDIIWAKPNPMPESVTDRCTKSHEYVFLMSKSPKYYYDNEAIKEEAGRDWADTGVSILNDTEWHKGAHGNDRKRYEPASDTTKRNKRSVWTIATHPFPEAHFATFPEDLIAPMIKAGCPENGIVLDIFMGAGTTAVVARKLNRNYLGIELNTEYIKMAEARIRKIGQPLL